MRKFIILFLRFFKKKEKPLSVVEAQSKAKLGLIIGHSPLDKGAVNTDGVSEYDFYKEDLSQIQFLTSKLQLEVIERPLAGLSGIDKAYKKAKDLGCDAVIEFHFNAANTVAMGTETLCSFDEQDYRFALMIQKAQCESLNRLGMSRGVKKISKSVNGGRSVHGFTGPNCLVEPFFGDVKDDTARFKYYKNEYYKAVLKAVENYFGV